MQVISVLAVRQCTTPADFSRVCSDRPLSFGLETLGPSSFTVSNSMCWMSSVDSSLIVKVVFSIEKAMFALTFFKNRLETFRSACRSSITLIPERMNLVFSPSNFTSTGLEIPSPCNSDPLFAVPHGLLRIVLNPTPNFS